VSTQTQYLLTQSNLINDTTEDIYLLDDTQSLHTPAVYTYALVDKNWGWEKITGNGSLLKSKSDNTGTLFTHYRVAPPGTLFTHYRVLHQEHFSHFIECSTRNTFHTL
jgi:hypothetical protein